MISVIKYDEAVKNIIAIKKSMNNILERKANNIPKIIADSWETRTDLDRIDRFIWYVGIVLGLPQSGHRNPTGDLVIH